ncbi:MAG TPA: hypothetical protein VM032_18495 [Vicinamibacterales bacterium]|nr:hypothetical protein [Vicinamibacterales bacterium]
MDLKLLLKRGGLLAAANWPVVVIQFAAQTTFQVLLAVPVIGAAILVAVLLGGDLANLLAGSMREIFGTITGALMSEPFALGAFIVAFVIALVGGSVLMFLVKGGTVAVMVTANDRVGDIERRPVTLTALAEGATFSIARYSEGCGRLFRPYLRLGLALMVAYALTGAAYLAFIVYGYRAAGDGILFVGWTFLAAIATIGLVLWTTAVNLVYLLLQIAMAAGEATLPEAVRAIARFTRAEFRELGGIFLVVFGMVVAAWLASALAWSGVGLIAFVPLVGLAVFPLQIAALLLRGLIFEYIGLTAMGAYVTLYRRYATAQAAPTSERASLGDTASLRAAH